MNRRALGYVTVGETLPTLEVTVRRADLIRYAGASLDFNPIHWHERTATTAGLPGVIAHGMFIMGLGGRFLSEWVGDPGAIIEYGVVFSRPVVVPDDEQGMVVTFSGKVTTVDEDHHTVTVALTVSAGGQRVLSRANGVLNLSSPQWQF